jgi:hypothetical protein
MPCFSPDLRLQTHQIRRNAVLRNDLCVLKFKEYEHTDHERRIAELEDEIKQQKARIAELTEERDEQAITIAEQDELVDSCLEMIETWKDAFDMSENDKGDLVWGPSTAEAAQGRTDAELHHRSHWPRLADGAHHHRQEGWHRPRHDSEAGSHCAGEDEGG